MSVFVKVLYLLRINLREFRFAHTMIFAIEEINNSSTLLPNISIGYKVLDSCGSALPSVQAVMALMDGQDRNLGEACSSRSPVQAIIGASESSSTIVMLQTSGIFHIPMVKSYHYISLLYIGSNCLLWVAVIFRRFERGKLKCEHFHTNKNSFTLFY